MTDQQRATMRAAIDRIVPRDEYPSASEAGVIDFLDRLVAEQGLEEIYQIGLDHIDKEASVRTGQPFAELEPERQDEVLVEIEQWTSIPAKFVRLLAEQTIEGYYADPGNGGNRDRVAWDMIGYRVTV